MTCYQPHDKTLPRMLRGRHGEECPARLAETALSLEHEPHAGSYADGTLRGPQNGTRCDGCQPCPGCIHGGDGTHTRTCIVCHTPLPPQTGPGRPRKVCPDEHSPTPGGCRDYHRNSHRQAQQLAQRITGTSYTHAYEAFPNGGFIIE